jgi:16S rRNA processing protein RimM
MTSAWDEMVVVGRIARAQGNRGQVIVDPMTDFPEERFRRGSMVQIRRGDAVESLTIEDVRFHRGRPVIDFAGVDSMDAAEALAGTELRITIEALQPLPPGAFYHHDLVGCTVQTKDGERIGEVASVEGEATGSRLVVKKGGAEILIPMVDGICASVDIAGRTIVVEPPDGLLDLNVTKRQKF